ncbi:hypothetical protein MEBOL_002349 [Melittangium boletus DSM 14713]|uniref:Calcineurin-like phosphoesterase domain-containing protein n=2 Tax=Melittangium boletus TaxID=83453 RepID=A0A250ICG3_9BACT|nr:hypothetical protein MEBOL_002349 [Melittangium boletus DSM 14713]
MVQEGEPLFSWLHLSDIHFGHGGPEGAAHRKLVLDCVLLDVQRAMKNGAPVPNAVFVTGDIGFSGGSLSSDEYRQAGDWFAKLASVLRIELHEIYLVPGNHDVARVSPSDGEVFQLITLLRKGEKKLGDALGEPATGRLLAGRLDNFLEFSRRFGPTDDKNTTKGTERLFWRRKIVARGGLPVRLVGLNTALLANDDEDNGVLRVSTSQFALVFDELAEKELVIVLGHHPFDWLSKDMDPLGWLQAKAHLFLSGHVHQQETLSVQRGGGRQFVHVIAGAGHSEPGPSESERYTFNFGAVFSSPGRPLQLRLWPYIWTKHKDFRPDVENLHKDSMSGAPKGYIEHLLAYDFSLHRTASPTTPIISEPEAEPRPSPRLSSDFEPSNDGGAPRAKNRRKPAVESPAERDAVVRGPAARQVPPPESRPGRSVRLVAAMVLLMGGVGFIYQGRSRSASRQVTPPVQVIRIPDPPYISGNGLDALVKLRQMHKVRPLQRSETSRAAAALPEGVFAFLPMSSLKNPQQALVQPAQSPDSMEVHMTSAGSLHLVGFIKEGDSQLVMSGKATAFSVSPRPFGSFQTVMSLPAERVRWVRLFGARGEQWADLQLRDAATGR